jgi:hypothetical protein
MEVPRYWRLNKYRLTPNANGYRPKLLEIPEPEHSAKITCSSYRGSPDSLAGREVQTYSQLLKPGFMYTIPAPKNESIEAMAINEPSGVVG